MYDEIQCKICNLRINLKKSLVSLPMADVADDLSLLLRFKKYHGCQGIKDKKFVEPGKMCI